MDPRAFLASLDAEDELVHVRELPARANEPGPFPEDVPELIRQRLALVGVTGLFEHQREAFDLVRSGRNVIVATGTASGKTLVYNLAFATEAVPDPKSTALYLFPTKALARDQLRQVRELKLPQLRAGVYDGDTPRSDRPLIRKNANLVMTNPDMLHAGILPDHPRWADFFLRLSVVVVDESHVFRGVFGSHVAHVLRRLRRLVAHYGGDPGFVLASATVGNPAELAERLVGEPFDAVTEDRSPSGGKTFALWNPAIVDEESGARRSALTDTSFLMARLAEEGVKSIGFARSRRAAELLAGFTRRDLDAELRSRVKAYRAGYLAGDRRELERQLANDELIAVASTNALELGIDIGSLDAAICVTFPGTVASLRQQWGRAGRRGRGLAVYVAGEDALDQFFCRHPDEFLDRPVENAILDHENEQILAQHVLCAAHEGPLDPADEEFLGPSWKPIAERLVSTGALRERPGGLYVPRRPEEYPAAAVSLRSASRDGCVIVDTASGELIGTVDLARAMNTTHEGAVYLHGGRQFEVSQLDLEARRVLVHPFAGDWYTQPKRETDTYIEALLDRREHLGVTLSFGTVTVTEQVLAYQRKRMADHEALDLIGLDLPETSFTTQALWYELGPELLRDDFPLHALLGALHAAEHSQIAVLPLIAMCDRWDIGGLSTNLHPQTGGPTIFIYDGHPGGIGITRRGFLAFDALVDDAHRLITECPCERGCPSCVQSPKCGNLNEPLSKLGAAEVMGRMLAAA